LFRYLDGEEFISPDTGSRPEWEEVEGPGYWEEFTEEVDEEYTLRCKPWRRLTIPRAVSGVPALALAAECLDNRLLLRPVNGGVATPAASATAYCQDIQQQEPVLAPLRQLVVL
jgi:hypothetical protein